MTGALCNAVTPTMLGACAGAQETAVKDEEDCTRGINPFRLAITLAPTGQNSERIKQHAKSALQRYQSSPCEFDTDGAPHSSKLGTSA